ncbi:hypothetical protein [Ralstonia pseudosolanacearum]|uniref:hypothetical protein n=1 Tax=Ralstonia pseudosolanacearum TaxID=1310165 RepID=UPI003CE6D4BC
MELVAEELAFEIQVSGRGDTVWVNASDGTCVGRFSKRFGIDVHRTIEEMMGGAGQCLFCTHGVAGPDEWDQFRAAVKEHFGIDVPADTISFVGEGR